MTDEDTPSAERLAAMIYAYTRVPSQDLRFGFPEYEEGRKRHDGSLSPAHSFFEEYARSIPGMGEVVTQAIEAQRAATVEQGAVHESAVAESDAPKGATR